MPSLNIEIYSNDNNTLLQTISLSSTESGFATVDSTGASFYKDGESTPDGTYRYTGEGVFTGFTITPNTTTPTYGIGDTFNIGINTNQHLNIVAGTAVKKITYDNKPVQVESAIRDGTGKVIANTYAKKPVVYERTTQSSTSTTCTLIQFNASDYKANGYLAHFRFRVRSVLQDSYPSDNEFIINYSYLAASLICTNNKYTTSNDIVQNIYAYYPISASYVDTGNYFIAFRTGRASTDFIIEMIEADVPYTIPATMSTSTTTNATYQLLTPGNFSSGMMWAGTAVGNISGNADGSSSYTKQLLLNKYVGDTVYTNSLCGVDTAGLVSKILTSGKKFPLPIRLSAATSSASTGNITVTRLFYDTVVSNNYLTNATYQGGNGFTLPTFTASDAGKILYIRGSLDTVDGKPVFVPDGNITIDMSTGGYTYIPFGELYNSSSAPTFFYWDFTHTVAYTLDANGKLTHIDGKPVGGGGGDFVVGNVFQLTEVD